MAESINTKPFKRGSPSKLYTEYLDYYIAMHKKGKAFDGRSLKKFVNIIGNLIQTHQCKTLLDYGAGRGILYGDDFGILTDILDYYNGKPHGIDKPLQEYWRLDEVCLYEPALPGLDKLPSKSYDAVISTDVLEHIPESDLGWVIDEIFSKAKQFVFLNIATFPALKTFPDGTNVHVSLFKSDAWVEFLSEKHKQYEDLAVYLYFDVVNSDRTVSYQTLTLGNSEPVITCDHCQMEGAM